MNRKERHDRRGRGHHGAKTFRRGRALAFYEKLIVRRDTLKQQLESQELKSIQQVIAGELKATEAIMNDFKAAFELDEISNTHSVEEDPTE
ncbi:2-keto-3-deoxygluconate kinase [Lysinibacillus sp. SGAir0095]|nr:2-keto-3-deoxygluconate kinase [Lysinibacillus sp. SGAir0095]